MGDVVARYWRLQGYDVMHPIGWDSFRAARRECRHRSRRPSGRLDLCQHRHPSRLLQTLRAELDWSRRLHTSDPEYYRWTQWLFLRFYERGLAYRKDSYVNWCPNDQTVLANEQVVQGECERCHAVVTKRKLTQWYFKITDYAQRLLDDMDLIEGTWPDRVLSMQRNWIGRSEGAWVDFEIEGRDEPVRVFTTGPTPSSVQPSSWLPLKPHWPPRS